jgi:hypothetical protein
MAIQTKMQGCEYKPAGFEGGMHPGKRDIIKHAPSQVDRLGRSGWVSEGKPAKVSVKGKGQK